MQSLGQTNRLPRLIAGTRSDDLGSLRPGRDHASEPARPMLRVGHPVPYSNRFERRSRFPYGWMTTTVVTGLMVAAAYLPPSVHAQMRAMADRLVVATGFGVDHVAVLGYDRTSMSDIATVLDLDTERSLLGFDGAEVRRKLQTLPWVDTVRVVHILPNTVSIRITERTPFAVWQNRGKHYLVDRSGHTLGLRDRTVPEGRYPLVVGKGAGLMAGKFLDTVARHPRVARQMKAAVRVGDRRWNLVLKSGKKILLPESGVPGALAMLEVLLSGTKLNRKHLARIDLRIPARPTVRLAKPVHAALKDMKDARRAAAILMGRGAS